MSLSIAAWTGLTFDLAEFLSSTELLFLEGLMLSMLVFFLQSLLLFCEWLHDLASLFLLSVSCMGVNYLQSHCSTFVCFCKAEPRALLCFVGLGRGCRQLTPGLLVTAADSGEKLVVQSSNCPAAQGGPKVDNTQCSSDLWIPLYNLNADLEHTTQK